MGQGSGEEGVRNPARILLGSLEGGGDPARILRAEDIHQSMERQRDVVETRCDNGDCDCD